MDNLSEENTLPTYGNFMVSILFDVIKFLLIYRHLQNTYRFKRGSLTVTRSTLWGSRIAHRKLNEQRRSPRRYVYTICIPLNWQRYTIRPINTSMDIYRCLIPDLRLKLARFQSVKNKASSKRLYHKYDSPLPRHSSWVSLSTLCGLLHFQTAIKPP